MISISFRVEIVRFKGCKSQEIQKTTFFNKIIEESANHNMIHSKKYLSCS